MEQIKTKPKLKKACIDKRNNLKGIILAGGNATRLYPLTTSVPKSLLPIYNKPTIYYPLNLLKKIGCKEILIICKPEFLLPFQNLLQDGSQFGLTLHYKIQNEPKGIAEAFIIGEEFIGNDNVVLCLGDNVFLMDVELRDSMRKIELNTGEEFCHVLEVKTANAENYGVYDREEKNIIEKPKNGKEYHYAIPGLYVFDHTVCQKAKQLKPSARGELEITDLMKIYNEINKFTISKIYSMLWVDTGNFEDLLDAGNLVKAIEKRTGTNTCYELFI